MTTLETHNASDRPVLVYLTLGAMPGCVQDVSTITFDPAVSLIVIAPLMGSFWLDEGQTVKIEAPVGLGLNGNLCFGTPPLNCPCTEWPEGVALAEFIVNETVDISCVCGSNAYLGFDLSAGDCTSSDAPPSCVGQQPQFANTEPICNVQRPAAGNQGGTVKVSFFGWTPVPL